VFIGNVLSATSRTYRHALYILETMYRCNDLWNLRRA